jgi:hypothetical protein
MEIVRGTSSVFLASARDFFPGLSKRQKLALLLLTSKWTVDKCFNLSVLFPTYKIELMILALPPSQDGSETRMR